MDDLEAFVDENNRLPVESRTRPQEEENLAMKARYHGLLKKDTPVEAANVGTCQPSALPASSSSATWSAHVQQRIQDIHRKANDKANKVAFANEAPPAEDLEASASTSAVVAASMRFPEADVESPRMALFEGAPFHTYLGF